MSKKPGAVHYEKVRLDGVIQSQPVLVAIGINWDGRRCVLSVELSNRESRSSWTNFVTGLKARGLHGVEFVVSDDHAGLKRAVAKLLPRRCGNGVTCIFSATHSTTCPARPMTITGESYRLREKRRAGALKLSAPPPPPNSRPRAST